MNKITYNTLILGLVKANRVDESLSIYDDIMENGFPPSPFTYYPLIDGICKAGRVDEESDLFQEMAKARCMPNCDYYISLMNAFRQVGNIHDVCKHFSIMVAEGIQLDLNSFSILIFSLCMKVRIDGALHIFEELKAHFLNPDTTLYNTIIDGLRKAQKYMNTLIRFNEMKKIALFQTYSPINP